NRDLEAAPGGIHQAGRGSHLRPEREFADDVEASWPGLGNDERQHRPREQQQGDHGHHTARDQQRNFAGHSFESVSARRRRRLTESSQYCYATGNLPEERAVSEPTDDFAAMFEASIKAKRIEKGQTLEGTIVALGPEVALVDVGGKSEATIDIGELKDDEGDLEVAVGDRIQAVVVSTAGGLTLSRKLARRAATERQLEDAFHTGLPVEGKVERAVKGGYEVRIARQRAFCPISQIDTFRNTDPAEHAGRVYEFRIIEYAEGGRNIVVSRRALLEEEQ